mgnify:CR=1 FL=1
MKEKDKQHIIQEVNIQRELKSPFIVKYIDRFKNKFRHIDKKNQKISIIMEYCKFGSLKTHIQNKKDNNERFDENSIWKIISQIS